MAKKTTKRFADLNKQERLTGSMMELIRPFFSTRRQELQAALSLPAGAHSGMVGSHRETLQRLLLTDILPRRYSVDTGMVYGPFQRSLQSDIVIWDSSLFPSLPAAGHRLFFAESVRVVMECKSAWSESEFVDAMEKSRAVKSIITMKEPTISDHIAMIYQELHCIKHDLDNAGALIHPYHISTAALFASGGSTVTSALVNKKVLPHVDSAWPDTLILLEPGILVTKRIDRANGGHVGLLEFSHYGDDVLLAFAKNLLKLLGERTASTETLGWLDGMISSVLRPTAMSTIEYPLTEFPPHTKSLIGHSSKK